MEIAPCRILTTVARLWQTMLTTAQVEIDGNNCMEKMGYERKRDSFSCGFYVLSAIGVKPVRSDFMPPLDYCTYCSGGNELIRDGCTGKYLYAVFAHHESTDKSLINFDVFRSTPPVGSNKVDVASGMDVLI